MSQTMPAKTITAHYRFSLADYLALTDAMYRRSWRRGTLIVLLWLVIVVTIMGLISDSWAQFWQALSDLVHLNGAPLYFYALVAVIPAVVVFMPQLRRLQARRIYSWNAIADLEIGLQINAIGVHTTMPGRSSQTQWSAVRGMKLTATHMFLTVSRREAIVVPRRAFASEAAFETVVSLARASMSSNH